ncbi:MAG: hypothetical protein JNL21_02915 [Myxococcales bacterium]|nr:hypothetical protein [Myxococcales bacterium]
MADLYSKVTLRPRSKLERLVDLLEPSCDVPGRPKNGLCTQLALYFLLWGEAPPHAAAEAVKTLRTPDGQLDPAELGGGARALVESLCSAARVDEVAGALQAVARLAAEGLETVARRDPEEARRRLASLPRLPADQADFLLLASGCVSTVAPSPAALRVVSRVGYPGTSYAALARAIDAELPEGDPHEVAWRAHHVLKQHGLRTCKESPACSTCRAEPACSYAGKGDDPFVRVSAINRNGSAPPGDGAGG